MLRYYHPLEFTCSYLNNANNDEDIVNGEDLANLLNIEIRNPKFRFSRSEYFLDRESNSIYKGIKSIKNLNIWVRIWVEKRGPPVRCRGPPKA